MSDRIDAEDVQSSLDITPFNYLSPQIMVVESRMRLKCTLWGSSTLICPEDTVLGILFLGKSLYFHDASIQRVSWKTNVKSYPNMDDKSFFQYLQRHYSLIHGVHGKENSLKEELLKGVRRRVKSLRGDLREPHSLDANGFLSRWGK